MTAATDNLPRLTDGQRKNLRKLAKAQVRTGPGGMESVRLTPSELKGLESKGLAYTFANHQKGGHFPSFITTEGRRVAAALRLV